MEDQVWMQFRNVDGALFGFCYIPPCDSPYYSHGLLASIEVKVNSRYMHKGYFIVGDMNARFGNSVRQLLSLTEIPDVSNVVPSDPR